MTLSFKALMLTLVLLALRPVERVRPEGMALAMIFLLVITIPTIFLIHGTFKRAREYPLLQTMEANADATRP